VIQDIEQQQYVFEILWDKSVPAEQRIKEIEEGTERVETIALKNISEIAKRIDKNIESSNEIKISFQPGGLELVYNNFLGSYKKVLDRYRRGEHKGIRFITTINKVNEGLATLLLNEGVQIRHTKNLTPLSFCISNKEFLATAEKMKGGKMISSLLVSTEPVYIDHYDSLFEELWDNSIDATDRINDIKEGVDLADIEVIPRSARSRLLYLDLVKKKKSKSRINQVISNLLNNAIKFTKEGTITAAIVPNNNEIIVSINDTGSGIDSEVLPKLFTRFGTTTTKSTTGTGLGLFISKSIIDAHGGRIWGKNNYPEGKGATFGFSLPLYKFQV
jgi:two-component system, OmpR family, sensor histidine kinase VicK